MPVHSRDTGAAIALRLSSSASSKENIPNTMSTAPILAGQADLLLAVLLAVAFLD